MNRSHTRTLEFWLLIVWNVPAFFISTWFVTNAVVTVFLFAGVPAVYLSLRRPELARKLSLAAFVLILPLVAVIDYFAHTDGSWYNPSSFVDFRVLGVYPVDDFLWGFIYFYYIVIFYEYFYEKERKLHYPGIFKKFFLGGVTVSLLFTAFLYTTGTVLQIPYFYASVMVLVLLIGLPAITLGRHPRLFNKVLHTTLALLPQSFFFEYAANLNHNWWFPGRNFIGRVEFFNVSFPFEELVFMVCIFASVLSMYELIADDGK